MRTINNINNEIKWEQISLDAMKAELTKRKTTGEPTEHLLYWIDASESILHHLKLELAELENQ